MGKIGEQLRWFIGRGFHPFPARYLIGEPRTLRARVGALYARQQWRRSRSPVYRAGLIVSGLVWPAVACVLAVGATRRFGADTRARSGRSEFRQWVDQCVLAFRHALAPGSYYLHELDRAEIRAGVGDIVDEPEMRAMMRRINADAD